MRFIINKYWNKLGWPYIPFGLTKELDILTLIFDFNSSLKVLRVILKVDEHQIQIMTKSDFVMRSGKSVLRAVFKKKIFLLKIVT